MRKWFFLASCAVLFCGSLRADDSFEAGEEVFQSVEFDSSTLQAVTNLARSIAGVNATQATVDDTAASILALLQTWSVTGTSPAIRSYPAATTSGFPIGTQLGRGLFSTWNANSPPATSSSYLYQIQRALFGASGTPAQSSAVIPLLLTMTDLLRTSTTSSSSSVSLSLLESLASDIATSAASIDSSLQNIDTSTFDALGYLYSIDSVLADLDFTEYSELRVHDDDLLSELAGFRQEFNSVPWGSVGSQVDVTGQVSVAGFDQVELGISQIVARVQVMDQVDVDSEDLGGDISDTADDIEDQYQSELEDLEDEDLPTIEGTYTPSVNPSEDHISDLGLDQMLPNSHNALITLVPRRRSGASGFFPDGVEVDLGRDSSFVSAVGSLYNFFSWLWGILFTLLLSVKGVSLYRKARLATTQIAVDASSLPMSLAWDPF